MRTSLVCAATLSLALFSVGCGTDRGEPSGERRDSGMMPMMGTDSGTPMMGTDSGTPMMGTDSGTPMMGTDSGTPMMMGSGACTNSADLARMEMHDMDMVVGDCAGGCFGGADCSRDCVIKRTMISMACGQCWGEVVGCTSSMCAFDCFDGDSPACAMCRDSSGCTAAFEMCSGLTE